MLLLRIGLDVIQAEEQALTGRALAGLAQIPGLKLYGIKDPDSPRFARKRRRHCLRRRQHPARPGGQRTGRAGRDRRALRLPLRASVDQASGRCSPLLEQLQGVILTLFPRLNLPGVVRVSLGIENSAEDVDALVQVLGQSPGSPGPEPTSPSTSLRTGPSLRGKPLAKRRWMLSPGLRPRESMLNWGKLNTFQIRAGSRSLEPARAQRHTGVSVAFGPPYCTRMLKRGTLSEAERSRRGGAAFRQDRTLRLHSATPAD